MTPSHRIRLLLAISGLATAALLTKGDAARHGQSGNRHRSTILNRVWPAAAFPLPWVFSNATTGPCNYASTSAPAAQLQPAVAAGFTTHQNVVDSALSFTFAGNVAPATLRNIGLDGSNLVTFCDAAVLAADQGFLARTPSTANHVHSPSRRGAAAPWGRASRPT